MAAKAGSIPRMWINDDTVQQDKRYVYKDSTDPMTEAKEEMISLKSKVVIDG
jgi:hypothetical protein